MSEPRVAGLALDTALLVTLGTALLFVAGWGYAEQWFAWFDLGLVGLGLPTGYFAMYGYWTLADSAWWLLLAGAALTAAVAGGRWWRAGRGGAWSRLWSGLHLAAPVLLLALVLLLFWGAYALGRQAADLGYARDRANGFCAFPNVRVVLKEPGRLPAVVPGVPEALAAGQYRLLIQSGGVLALFRPNLQHAPLGRRRPSLVVPVAEVAVMELNPVQPWCGPR